MIKVTISVGVQKMVNAKCAGVMFTIDPVMGDENKIVVEGNWGLGEKCRQGGGFSGSLSSWTSNRPRFWRRVFLLN